MDDTTTTMIYLALGLTPYALLTLYILMQLLTE
jgi:hypothetical protein